MPNESRNWALLVEYDGAPFVGWQRQRVGVSIQLVMERAAARLAGGGGEPACLGSGRTDAGVHAAGQVAMLALPAHLGPGQVRDGLNFYLKPHPVAVRAAIPAPPGWHPRFSAIERLYRYRILTRRARPVLDTRVWHLPCAPDAPLDLGAMQRAAAHLVGRHDFTAFRALACQARSPVRTLDELSVRETQDGIEIVARARSFLHHQVRNMAGSLARVGQGRWPPIRLAEILAGRDRALAGPTAPAAGLCLMAVRYDPPLFD